MRENVGQKSRMRKKKRLVVRLPSIHRPVKVTMTSSNKPIKTLPKSQSLPCLAGVRSSVSAYEDPFHAEQDIHQYCKAANSRVITTMKSCILAAGWGSKLRKRAAKRKGKSGSYNPAVIQEKLAEIRKVFENAKTRREMKYQAKPSRTRERKEEKIKEILKKQQEKKNEVQVNAQRVNEHEERVYARLAHLRAYPEEATKLKKSVRQIFADRKKNMLRLHDDAIQRNIENGGNWREVRERQQIEKFEARYERKEQVRQRLLRAEIALCSIQDLEYKKRIEAQGRRRSELMELVEREKAKMMRQNANVFQKPWLVIIALGGRMNCFLELLKVLPAVVEQSKQPGRRWKTVAAWWKKKSTQRKKVNQIYRRSSQALFTLQAAQKSRERIAAEVILDFFTKILPDPWIKFRLVLEMRRYQERAKTIQKWWRYVYRLRMTQVAKLSALWDKQEKKILKLSMKRMNKLAKQGKSGEVADMNASIRKRGSLSTLIAAGHIHIHNKVPQDEKRTAILKLMHKMRKKHKKIYRQYLRELDATAEKRRIQFRIEQAKREFLGRPPLTKDDEVIGKPKPPVFDYIISPKPMRAVITETGKQLALRRMTEMMTPVKQPKYAEFSDVEDAPVSAGTDQYNSKSKPQKLQTEELITPVKNKETEPDILTL